MWVVLGTPSLWSSQYRVFKVEDSGPVSSPPNHPPLFSLNHNPGACPWLSLNVLFCAAWLPWITAGGMPGLHFSFTGGAELVEGCVMPITPLWM